MQELANKEEIPDDDGICEMNCILNENKRYSTLEPLSGNEKMKLTFPSPEKSISSIDSLGMINHSDLNLHKQEALNAAFENIDSFIENRSVT